ncbi:MAG: cell surface protein SprA [candidate division Zixibacteria bacterium]|nr:cell surface protein SprA [candidate division Zixibacteria bacterium]
MNLIFKRIFFSSLFALLVSAACPFQAMGEVGFKAELSNPPLVVSVYDDIDYTFSAALYPRSRPPIRPELQYNTKVIRSNFEDNSVTFETEYKKGYYLIPVSVDANQFLNYRLKKNYRRKFDEVVFKSYQDAQTSKKREGFSIGVALPKRLDKIFGEGGGNLKVTGYRRISFSGRSQWTDGKSDLIKQSKFPSLNMEQQSKFEITGTIGTKISVKVYQDSQTDIPLANRIQIRYKGDEDDILKSIEAGNTTLSLPNTKFVGYTSRIQGLFGLKTEAQLGSLTFTGIASQEKGSTESSTITASGEENAEYIRDHQYVTGRIFDLGYPVDNDADPNRVELGRYDSVVTLYVYEYESDRSNLEAVQCKLLIDPANETYLSSQSDSLRMMPLKEDIDYTFYNDRKRDRHYVVFKGSRYEGDALGIYMVVKRFNSASETEPFRVDTIGDLSGEIKILKTLRPSQNKNNPDHKTWALMWRNCYRISAGLNFEDFDIKIIKGLADTEGKSSNLDYQAENGVNTGYYLAITGLDQVNSNEDSIPDNILDRNIDFYRSDWGLLIFPSRTPFDTDTTFTDKNGKSTPVLAVTNPNIYSYYSPKEKTEGSQYYIQISTKTRSSQIRLNRTNVIEGSERVTLNGSLLERDRDYTVSYDFGQITLLKEEALDPNAEVKVDFEYAPFFAVQKKTLLGARAEYEWNKDIQFGSTVLYKSDKAQERKPRVGQETAKMMVLDFDAKFKLYPSFLTKLADALPMVTTESQSVMTFEGEIAKSFPNPNVDGVAYVDDFEAAHEQLSLGINRLLWTQASSPVDEFLYERGKILWHNPRQQPFVEEVYDREAAQGEGTITTLRLVFRPKTVHHQSGDSVASWGGIMRSFVGRIDPDRAQLFEIRARGGRGRLHFDFGVINEDVNGDNSFFTEDKDGNGVVDTEEDVGLDGMSDAQEQVYYNTTEPDPSGDNYYFFGQGKCPVTEAECTAMEALNPDNYSNDSIYYEWLNGTEGNSADIALNNRPDEEVLTNSGSESNNAYFSYVIDLSDSTDQFLVPGSYRDLYDTGKPWRTFQISLKDPLAVDDIVESDPASDTAKWANVTHVRVWMESDDSTITADTLEIADWYFVQSNWKDTIHSDPYYLNESNTNFVVASVSTENGTFDPPPGVEAYEDKQTKVTEPQRGLSLKFKDLHYGDTCLAVKKLVSVEQYSGYGKMEMYINGGKEVPENVMFFFRLGRDENNYYEYQVRELYPGWDERNYVTIDFNKMTALKDEIQRNLPEGAQYTDVDTTVNEYRIRGNPRIDEVLYFAAGVLNIDEENRDNVYSGDIWLDELRLTDVRKDVGTAGRVSITGNMADLLNYNFSYNSQDPYFRGIAAATRGGSNNNLGSGKTKNNSQYGLTLNFDKFLPKSWGSRLPISFSQSNSTEIPVLRTNSDIVLAEDVRESEKSTSDTRTFRISESFNKKSRNPLFSILLNRQSVSFSYNRSKSKSVNRPFYMAENYNIKADYDMGLKSKIPTLPIFFWAKPIPLLKKTSESRLSLYPSTWRWSGTYNRKLTINDDINGERISSFTRDFSGTLDLKYDMFENLSFSYNYTTRRDLSDPKLVNLVFNIKDFKLGQETNYNQSFTANYDPRLFSFFTTSFSFSTRYLDNYERTTKTLSSDMNRTWSVRGNFNHISFLGGDKKRAAPGRAANRQNVRAGGVTTKADNGKPFYGPPLAFLRFLTGWVEPLNYKYNRGYKNSLPGMKMRPSMVYRLGFHDRTDVPLGEEVRPQTSNESEGYDLSSGFTLLGGISTDVKFKRDINRDLIKQGTRYEKTSTNWPDLSIRIQRFQTFPLFKSLLNKFIDIFAPRTGYSRQIKEEENLDMGFLLNRTESINHNPLISLNFKLFQSLSLSCSYTVNKSTTENYTATTGSLESETNSTKKTIGFTSRYSFSAPSGIAIPLLGKVKFKSNVSIDLDVKFNSNVSETFKPATGTASSTDKSDLTITPVIQYNFSQQIKGGISARWQDSNDNYYGRKSHVRELQIWTEIRF